MKLIEMLIHYWYMHLVKKLILVAAKMHVSLYRQGQTGRLSEIRPARVFGPDIPGRNSTVSNTVYFQEEMGRHFLSKCSHK